MIVSNNMSSGHGFWLLDSNLLSDPLYPNKCRNTIHGTVMEYIDIGVENVRKFEQERLCAYDILTSAAWKTEELTESLTDRIFKIKK